MACFLAIAVWLAPPALGAEGPVELPVSSDLHIRLAPDDDPGRRIGHFVANGADAGNETQAVPLACSSKIAWQKVEIPGVRHEELVQLEAGARVGFGVGAAGASIGASTSQLARVEYTLTARMVATYDPEALAACCDAHAEGCADRFIGEYLQATDGVIERVRSVEGSVGGTGVLSVVPIRVSTSASSESAAATRFEQPTWFAYRMHHTRQGSAHAALARQQSQVADRLDAILDRLPRRSVRSIYLEPPKWSVGCVASPGGEALYSLASASLARTHGKVSLLDAADLRATTLRTTLSPGPTGVLVNLDLRDPKRAVSQPMGGFQISPELLGLEPDSLGCPTDASLGLVLGERHSDGAPGVSVAMPVGDGRLCEGATIEARVQTSEPARVRVFSVAEDGTGWQIWPVEGSDRVESETSLGPMHPVRIAELGDPRVVAVAIPADGHWGPMDGWSGFCKVAGGLRPELYPRGATVDSATYVVLSPTAGSCDAAAPAASRQSILDALENAPTCE